MSMKNKRQVEVGELLGSKETKSLMIDVTVEQKGNNVTITLEDGKNLKDRTIKRGYLNREEFNSFMMLASLNMLINGERGLDGRRGRPIWDAWMEKNIMTPEQKKNIKMATTYFGKFINDVFNNNLDIKSKDRIINQLAKYDFRVVDDYSLQQIYKLMKSSLEDFHVDKDNFFDLVEAKMVVSCKGCTKNRCECELRTFFESKFIPPINEGSQCNCEYSYE